MSATIVAMPFTIQASRPKYTRTALGLFEVRCFRMALPPRASPIMGRTTGAENRNVQPPKMSDKIAEISMY